MAVVTADQVVSYTDISASAGTISTSGLIPIVQERIGMITGNYFTTDIYVQSPLTFDAAARTVTTSSFSSWVGEGFADGDEVYIYHSYRNDGYYDVLSISSGIMTLATGESVVTELSGRSIMVSLVRWPTDVSYAAAQMVKFDYDDRKTRQGGATSRSLGPYSESFAEGGGLDFGYPAPILEILRPYTLLRVV